jgi:hypothetical protein
MYFRVWLCHQLATGDRRGAGWSARAKGKAIEVSTTATTATTAADVRMVILLVKFVLAGMPWLPGRALLLLICANRIRVDHPSD